MGTLKTPQHRTRGRLGFAGAVALAGRLVWGRHSSNWIARLADNTLSFITFLLGFTWLLALTGDGLESALVGLVALVALGLRVLAATTTPALRWPRYLARAAVLTLVLFIAYQAVSLGSMLAWAVPVWGYAVVAYITLLSVVTQRRGSTTRVRIRPTLALALWVGLCMNAWRVENATARCDDFHRLIGQTGVSLVVPAATALPSCTPGTRLRPKRHPRKLLPQGEHRYLITTDSGRNGQDESPFDGRLCQLSLTTNGAGHQMACGLKGHAAVFGLAIHSNGDSLYVTGQRGVIMTAAEPPFAVRSTRPLSYHTGNSAFHAATSSVLVFSDGEDALRVLDPTTLAETSYTKLPINPEEIRFSPSGEEGLFCCASTVLHAIAGHGFLAVAFAADPSQVRALGAGIDVPWVHLAFSDGCDVDWQQRRALIGIGTLGILAQVDYDDGRLERWVFDAFGVRPVLVDAQRNRLFTGNYLDGTIRQYDLVTLQESRRWFGGRFIRHLVLSADGSSLLATSTLGVVRVDLRD